MILYVVRHAWAEQRGDPRWPDDFYRPLSPDGHKRFKRVVKALVQLGFTPEVVATSPLVRCRQTAELIVEGLPGSPELVELDALAPESDLDELAAWTASSAARCDQVAWVGHAPDVGELTAALIGTGGWIRFAKGAAAAIDFSGLPKPGRGELRWLVTAKMLGC